MFGILGLEDFGAAFFHELDLVAYAVFGGDFTEPARWFFHVSKRNFEGDRSASGSSTLRLGLRSFGALRPVPYVFFGRSWDNRR